MVAWPIKIPRKRYQGIDPAKRTRAADLDRIATLIENWVNQKALEQPSRYQIFTYRQIALALHLKPETVEKLCYAVDCGGNGFTVVRDDMPPPI